MKKYSVALCVFGIVLMGFSWSALAQQESYLFREITGFGGMTFGSYEEPAGGVALAFNISPRFGIEGEGGAIFAEDTKFNGSVNLVLNFGTGEFAFVPYLIGGGGVITNGGSEVAVNIGLGAKIFVAYNVALRADFRTFLVTEDGEVDDLERVYGGFTFFF